MSKSCFRVAAHFSSAALAIAAVAGVSTLGFDAAPALAGTATANLTVSASIAGACTVGGAALAFGTYTSAAASTTSTTVQVTCSNGTNATVSLNQGNNNNKASASGTRALANGANYLGYDIYSDSGYTTLWNTANTQAVVSTGNPVSLTAYGKIPAGQSPATGSYNDTVTITVTF
jgi:spore coat protein U-like protein